MNLKKLLLLSSTLLIILTTTALAATMPPKKNIIRIRFAGVSKAHRSEEAENTNLASYDSTSTYDAVWEAEIEDGDFPNAFPEPPKVYVATGSNTVKTKNGLNECNNALTLDQNRLPTVVPYNFDGDTVSIIIATPHFSRNTGVGATIDNLGVPLGCGVPLYHFFGPTDKTNTVNLPTGTVTTTVEPAMFNLPPSPGSTTPIERGNYAVFQVSKKNPSQSVSYKFEQQTTAQGGTEVRVEWRGFVSVEVNPKFEPVPVDPPTFLKKDPPYHPPEPSQPKEIKDSLFILAEKLFGGIPAAIKASASSQGQSSKPSMVVNEREGNIAVLNTNILTVSDSTLVPQSVTFSGTWSVLNKGDEEATVTKFKGIKLVEGTPPLFNLKVPAKLMKAIKKGLSSKITINYVGVVPGIKKQLKGKVKFSLPKRK